MALKLRRRAVVFTNRRLPQMTGAASFKRMLGGRGENHIQRRTRTRM